jgi:hypothetical protein
MDLLPRVPRLYLAPHKPLRPSLEDDITKRYPLQAIRSGTNGLAATVKASTREKDIGNGVLMEKTQKGV